ncbi:hypothetical protein M8J76_012209 [Diaphorina citri]|nr:hypothetical protein M8J76_012209 [Diaphorina citri]KAI5714699.1 hypothetical protein M8J77_003957 [Diaphorina citri]
MLCCPQLDSIGILKMPDFDVQILLEQRIHISGKGGGRRLRRWHHVNQNMAPGSYPLNAVQYESEKLPNFALSRSNRQNFGLKRSNRGLLETCHLHQACQCKEMKS